MADNQSPALLHLALQACRQPAALGTGILINKTNRDAYPGFCKATDHGHLEASAPAPAEYAREAAKFCKDSSPDDTSAICGQMVRRADTLAALLTVPQGIKLGVVFEGGSQLAERDKKRLVELAADGMNQRLSQEDHLLLASLREKCDAYGSTYALGTGYAKDCAAIKEAVNFLAKATKNNNAPRR
jgi:hypothetical protein